MRTVIFIASALVLVLISVLGTLGLSDYYINVFGSQSTVGSYLSSQSADLLNSTESFYAHCLGFGLA